MIRPFSMIVALTLTGAALCTRTPTDKGTEPPIVERACTWNGVDTINYLDSITCAADFERLQGAPLQQMYAQVKCVKFAYNLAQDHVYFADSKKFPYHYYFCLNALNYVKSLQQFNDDEYGCGPARGFCLGAINYYEASRTYTMEFFSFDCISSDLVEQCYRRCAELTWFGPVLKFMPTSSDMSARTAAISGKIPIIYEDQIFAGQTYQPLNLAETYGYLLKIDAGRIASTYLGHRDIVLTNGIPNDISAVAGIITAQFQTPLAHIAILSSNRGTPNMAYKFAWTDQRLAALQNQLVYLRVDPDSFVVRVATIDEAEKFWSVHEPSDSIRMECHDDSAGLFDLAQLDFRSTALVGAKAANFAELARIVTPGTGPVPLPEGAFAIPFYYYRQHMLRNGLVAALDSLLDDPAIITDAARRKTALARLRDRIIAAPIDREFVDSVGSFIRERCQYANIRFRSSTNAEDLAGFNGAGLYESRSAVPGDSAQSVEHAIKQVWASLWTVQGFEEREYFRIDQRSVAMGILVHRAFPNEESNGVAITKNLYNEGLYASTVNVQVDEVSVVNPPAGFIPDQFIFYYLDNDPFTTPAIEYISHSNVNGGRPVLTDSESVLLARHLLSIKQHFFWIFAQSSLNWGSFAMDVEFKFDTKDRKLYIKQARPYR